MRLAKALPVLLTLILGLLAAANAQDSAITAEIKNLRNAASRQQPNQQWNDLKPRIEESLDRAARALTSGREYLALEEMGRAKVYL